MIQNNIMPQQSEEDMLMGGGDVGPGARSTLKRKLDELGNKRGEFNAIQFAGKNKTENYRMDAIQQVFEVMEQYGIDPSNIDEVTAFIDQLEKQNPELYQIFIQAFEELMGGGGPMGMQQMPQESQPIQPELATAQLPMNGALGNMMQQSQQGGMSQPPVPMG